MLLWFAEAAMELELQLLFIDGHRDGGMEG